MSSSDRGGELGTEPRGGRQILTEEEAENWGVTFQAGEKQSASRVGRGACEH